MVKIICPDRFYQGTVGSVTFRDGVAETDNPQAIAFCKASGYQVLEDGLPEPPPANASQEVWADWVIANVPGVDPGQVRAMKRDELREAYGA